MGAFLLMFDLASLTGDGMETYRQVAVALFELHQFCYYGWSGWPKWVMLVKSEEEKKEVDGLIKLSADEWGDLTMEVKENGCESSESSSLVF